MASINGFQVKKIKKTRGREGEGFMCSMYLNGKEIGTYADYGNGDICPNIDYINGISERDLLPIILDNAKRNPSVPLVNLFKDKPSLYESKVEEFKRKHPSVDDKIITPEIISACSTESLVLALITLVDVEKKFKKGFKAVAVDDYEMIAYPQGFTDEQIKADAKKREINRIIWTIDECNIITLNK